MEQEKSRISDDIDRPDDREPMLPVVNPEVEKAQPPKTGGVHPAFYVIVWIGMSSSVILFNKWILDTAQFHFPILLTTWHLAFASFMTQLLARTTHLLDSRRKVKMTGRVYLRAIVPIGLFFSLSLICGNVTYLYLSVSFIQMLKATTPVAVLIASWFLGLAEPSLKTFGNVSIIVIGVVIASIGEIKFVLTGFLFQIAGIVFEAIRLAMVQRLLSSAEFKMDPIVSLYYFAPVCAILNGFIALFVEVPKISLQNIYDVGVFTLFINGMVAFGLNVSVVFLIGKTSSLVLTLCGVLKDIMLVCASMMIFGSPVSGLQFFGYSIALCGMVYYKLGGEKIKEYAGQGRRAWAEYGIIHPVIRKLIILASTAFTVIVVFVLLAPTYAPDYDPTAYLSNSRFGSGVGGEAVAGTTTNSTP